MLIRLQKYLSERGICSRRHAEEHILAGRIKVNGQKVTVLGTKVDPDRDKVEYAAEVIEAPQRLRYVILNKPFGIVTSCLQKGETTVKDLVACEERLFPVGRLDKDSTGLVLMTNDGTLAYRLMHPKFMHEKEYVVDTEEAVTEGMLEKLKKGVKIEGQMTNPCKILKVGPRRFRIVLREGRNRQIRKMVSKVGTEVTKLTRIRIENVRLGSLPQGCWRDLSFAEKYELFQRAGLPQKAEALKAAERRKPNQEPEIFESAWAKKHFPKKLEKEEFFEEDYSSENFEKGEEKVSYFDNEGAFGARRQNVKKTRRLNSSELKSIIGRAPEEKEEKIKREERRSGFKRPARARRAGKPGKPLRRASWSEEGEGYESRPGLGRPARGWHSREGDKRRTPSAGRRFKDAEKPKRRGKK